MTAASDAQLYRALRPLIGPGSTIAIGDGVGTPDRLADGACVGEALTALAHDVTGLRLVVGWLPCPIDGLEPDAFDDLVALMPGWGARDLLRAPNGRFVPTRLTAIGAALAGPLHPDVLVARLGRSPEGLSFTTEVSWQRELVARRVPLVAVCDDAAPSADAGPPIPADGVYAVVDAAGGPSVVPHREPGAVHDALADQVLPFVPAGARLQFGPGQLATSLLRRIGVPVSIDTGLLTDAVVDLAERGLLEGTPSATYLLGTERLYRWASGKPILHGIEHTHDLTRLTTGAPLIAVNTALEIDHWGQVNVEGVGDSVVGGIGGHPDFCAAGAMSRGGLSVIAVPSHHGKAHVPVLVERLSRPTSTPAYDVDVIVTENGHADLRGADWERRRELICTLFRQPEVIRDGG
jgi:hypothetical protein